MTTESTQVRGLREAAEYIGVVPSTIQRHIKKGTFPEPVFTYQVAGERTYRVWDKKDLKPLKLKKEMGLAYTYNPNG